MKHIILFIVFLLVFVLLTARTFAAGSCTQSLTELVYGINLITFTCTGDASDGSIPDTKLEDDIYKAIKGWYFYSIKAYRTPEGTAPDAADVFVLTEGNEDLLGSDDNSTAANGANLIHASLQRSAVPYIGLTNQPFFHIIDGLFSLRVASQATASANYTVILTFVANE